MLPAVVRGKERVGFGQGLPGLPGPTVSAPVTVQLGCARQSQLSGHKACQTADSPQTPWWHSQDGDGAWHELLSAF